jgi:hypothetical protein
MFIYHNISNFSKLWRKKMGTHVWLLVEIQLAQIAVESD